MEKLITGGCLCERVRYSSSHAPLSMGLCQCDRCQKQSGSAFLIATVFEKSSVKVEGELSVFIARDEKGVSLSRYFCPNCGSSVMITLDRYPDICSIMGGTLDDKSILRPEFSLWCSSGQPWLELPKAITLYPDYPDGLIA